MNLTFFHYPDTINPISLIGKIKYSRIKKYHSKKGGFKIKQVENGKEFISNLFFKNTKIYGV